MKKVPIIPVKLLEEEQRDIQFRRDNFKDVKRISKISTEFRPNYFMTSCYIMDYFDNKKKMIVFYQKVKGMSEAGGYPPIPIKNKWGTEVYVGPNYVEPFDSKERSYSKNYKKNSLLPEKYEEVSGQLEEVNKLHMGFFK